MIFQTDSERQETPASADLESGEIRIVSKIGFNEGQIELRDAGETKTGMILIRPGDLVLSGINATKGAIAIYGESETKPIAATIHYGAYVPNRERVDVRFLWWLLRSQIFRDILFEYLPGGIKSELKAKRFLPMPIPLPPLDEQRRLVARIEALAAKIEEARGLHRLMVEEAEALAKSYLDHTYQAVTAEHQTLRLADLCHTITDGDHITPRFSEEGVKFIFVGNVSSGYLHFQNCKHVDPEYFASIRPQRKPQRGDVLYSAVGATLGIPAVVDSDEDFCFQRHIAILKPDHAKIDSKYLWYLLRCGALYSLAWSKTTGSAQPTVPLNAIREFPIPTPPFEEQYRIVTYLDGLQAKVNAVRQLQAQTQEKLDALLPSVLDRAFRGEL